MKTFLRLAFSFLFFIIILGMVGAYFYTNYKRAHAYIALQCGAAKIMMPRAFMTLEKPEKVTQLNEYGCKESDNGCTCAKLDRDKQGIVFGILENTSDLLKIPEDAAGQTTFLTDVEKTLTANLQPNTSVNTKIGTLAGVPSLTISSKVKDEKGEFEGREIYFIHNATLYHLDFKTNAKAFKLYWPSIERSAQAITFVK
jgi:hypothetical protein